MADKKKILVVDDDVTFAKLIQVSLEQTGEFEVRIEKRGAFVVPVAQEYRPHAILLDVMMPHMDGPAVARTLQEDEKTARVPVAFLTSMVSRDETGPEGRVIRGFPFMAKPVTPQEIRNFV
ncbi:MAG: response regulator, partial [Candidatus Omnitrophica bacterium]|nr:response regulator [Candidatus Omnitrophota bacterium]